MPWKLRSEADKIPDGKLVPDYGGLKDVCTLIFHHSGSFMQKYGKRCYVGGRVNYIDFVEGDTLRVSDLDMMAAAVGLQGSMLFYFSMDGHDECNHLDHANDDYNSSMIGACVSIDLTVSVYVDHEGLDPEEIFSVKDLDDVDEEDISDMGEEQEEDVGGDDMVDEQKQGEGEADMVDEQKEDEGEAATRDEVDNISDAPAEGNSADPADILRANLDKLIDDGVEEQGSESDISDGEDSELSDYILDSEDEYALDNEDFSKFVDSDEDCGDEGEASNPGAKKQKRLKIFNEKTDMVNVKFFVGLCFKDIPTFRAALNQYAIEQGRSLKFPTNTLMKVQAKCYQKGCPWVIYGSRTPRDNTVMVKTLTDTHTCVRQERVIQATSRYLSKRYEMKVKSDPSWPVNSMVEIMQQEVGCLVSKWQMYTVKKKVAKMGDGDLERQFGDLYKYAAEVFRSNPHSTFRIKSKAVGDKQEFQRLYICWNALKLGMLDGNRRIICLDGCHLKTVYGGVLLTAVSVDGNNGIYPVAYAIVEKEKFNSWLWFLELLTEDLGITESNAYLWTVMSDKQKGLVDAVTQMLPYCDHRFCVRHLVANMKLIHKGLTLENIVWRAARSSRLVDFEAVMSELQVDDAAALEWLRERNPKHWSMAHFSTLNNTDMISNNMSECFNSMILQARSKGIISMLEEIRKKLMKRIGDKRKEMLAHTGLLCPNIQKKLDKNKVKSYGWAAAWNGHLEFEVTGPYEQSFYVHLGEKICSCRRWQLSGIPCPHVISCLNHMRYRPEEYVASCFHRETYLKVYNHFMVPLYGRDEWPVVTQDNLPPIVPPTVSQMPGRPKKHKRKLQAGEIIGSQSKGKMTKRGVEMSCKLCKETGHNSRTCPLNKGKTVKEPGLAIPAARESENMKEKKQVVKSKVTDMRSSPIPAATNTENKKEKMKAVGPTATDVRRSPRFKKTGVSDSVQNVSSSQPRKQCPLGKKPANKVSLSQPTFSESKGKEPAFNVSSSQPTVTEHKKKEPATQHSEAFQKGFESVMQKLPVQRNLAFSHQAMFSIKQFKKPGE